MIVLDRSCSMSNKPSGETRTKWQIAVDALGTLTTTYQGKLRLGLIMFPDETGASCAQDGTIYVNAGPDHEADVMAAVTATQPDGPCVTNIDTAIAQVGDDPAFDLAQPGPRRSFVLLITDGMQSGSCGGVARDPVTEQNIADLYTAGYPTYVVGFGDGVRPASLSAFATSGGVPRPGDPVYYQANTAAELDDALDAIIGAVISDDPEFGGCLGAPCPDDRCYGEYEQCVDGVCRAFYPDAGPTPEVDAAITDPGADAGLGGGSGDGMNGGCGCRSGAGGGGAAWLVLVVGALLLRPLRRSAGRRGGRTAARTGTAASRSRGND